MSPIGSAVWRFLRAYQVYGASTDVGKTIMSTIWCKAWMKRFPDQKVWYLKPVSTGPQAEADHRHVARFTTGVSAHCLFQFDQAVSPHIAARSMAPPSDLAILESVSDQLSNYAQAGHGLMLLETAGGVHSPTPTGSSQADLYRPLRLPVVLIGDHRLGGISSSISAFECLHMRGYDVDSVMLFEDDRYKNDEYLSAFFAKKGVPLLSLPPPPARDGVAHEDEQVMAAYYENVSKLEAMEELVSSSSKRHEDRIERLESMASRAHTYIWYPFTQHRDVSSASIMTIDSACGDFFQTYQPNASETTIDVAKPGDCKGTETSINPRLIQPTFDGSASWWTQGLGHAHPALTLSAAYAAGRYGHVMFAGAVHEPAVSLAELLLRNLDNPRLQKVFYSDNGSTGMEIAAKMALRATCVRYGWDGSREDVGILGLQGSYHGDTIGAMDCSEPSTFNEKVAWYRGRGYWFDFPKVKMANGAWVVEPPPGMENELGPRTAFSSLGEIFNVERREKCVTGDRYRRYIKSTLERLVWDEGKRFGALMMEPMMLGAGGMILVDPLFQRSLVQVVRENPHIFANSSDAVKHPSSSRADSASWVGLPVIFDEVFTGLYRLGRLSSASFLGVQPDISVHAKLLTGGLVPLCATLASESVFQAFLSSEKSDALLHGHSYTAHAVGCKVAETSVNLMLAMEKNGDWDDYKRDWLEPSAQASNDRDRTLERQTDPHVWSTWSKSFVNDISCVEKVEGVVALGSVLAISLRDPAGAGYTSTAANELRTKLFQGGMDWNVHSRILGNVLYLMASQTSKRETLLGIEEYARAALLGSL